LSKIGPFFKNDLRFLNGPPNVREPCGGVLDTLPFTLHHIITHARFSRFTYGTLVQPMLLVQPQSGGEKLI